MYILSPQQSVLEHPVYASALVSSPCKAISKKSNSDFKKSEKRG
jgi:hypothetical protein